MDRQIHSLGVRKPVIRVLHRDKLDHIVVREFRGIIKRYHFVLGAVQNDQVVRIFQIFVLSNIRRLQVIQELFADLDLAVKTHQRRFAFEDFVMVVFGHNAVGDRFIHFNGRTAERSFSKRISVFRYIFKEQKAPETGRISIELIGIKPFLHIINDRSQVKIAFTQKKILARIVAMTGPIESNNAKILVFGYDLAGKLFSSLIILRSQPA